MITMLSYVLFSYAVFDFPIHTLRLLHSLALASQFTLCTPFASVLSGISTNTAFNISLSFPALSRTCPENARGQGHAGPFHETIHLKRRPTTHWCTRRCRGSHGIVYGSADILGLSSTLLHICRVVVEIWVRVEGVKRIPIGARRDHYAIEEIFTSANMTMMELDK